MLPSRNQTRRTETPITTHQHPRPDQETKNYNERRKCQPTPARAWAGQILGRFLPPAPKPHPALQLTSLPTTRPGRHGGHPLRFAHRDGWHRTPTETHKPAAAGRTTQAGRRVFSEPKKSTRHLQSKIYFGKLRQKLAGPTMMRLTQAHIQNRQTAERIKRGDATKTGNQKAPTISTQELFKRAET